MREIIVQLAILVFKDTEIFIFDSGGIIGIEYSVFFILCAQAQHFLLQIHNYISNFKIQK